MLQTACSRAERSWRSRVIGVMAREQGEQEVRSTAGLCRVAISPRAHPRPMLRGSEGGLVGSMLAGGDGGSASRPDVAAGHAAVRKRTG